MAVAIDTSAGGWSGGASVSTLDVTLTVGSNSDRCLVLAISNESTTDTISGVAFTSGSGGTWTKLCGKVGGASTSELWYCVAPSTGSVTVRVTYSAANAGQYAYMWSVYGVDQTTPMAGGTTNPNLSDTTINVTVTSDDIAFLSQSGGIPNPWSAGTQSDTQVHNSYHSAGYDTDAATATFTINNALGQNSMAAGAAKAVSASGPVIPIRMAQTRMRTN